MNQKNRIGLPRLLIWAISIIGMMIVVPMVYAGGPVDKLQLYNDVWWSVFNTWVIVSTVGTVVCFGVLMISQAGCLKWYILIAGLVIALIGGPMVATTRATYASEDAWNAAVVHKSLHVEKLLGVWIAVNETAHPCKPYADTDWDDGALGATGCKYVTKVSYCAHEDDDGDCDDTDYKWYAWFDTEYTRTADLGVFKNGHFVFSDHAAPPDWQAHLVKSGAWIFERVNKPDDKLPGRDFEFEVSPDWIRIRDALAQKQLLPGVTENVYENWVFADKETVYRGSTYLVPDYEKRRVMPTINPVTNGKGQLYRMDIDGGRSGPIGYDFKIVQFLGSLKPSDAFQSSMQKTALLWAAGGGPKLKMNFMLNLALADEVPEPEQWIYVTKAHLMDNEVFGRNILPQNLFVVNCVVSRDQKTVIKCFAETGLFEDNVELKQDVSLLQPFPFTPEAMFGALNGGFVLDGKGNLSMKDGKAQTEFSFKGGVFNELVYGTATNHPFTKVSMDRYRYKQFVIQPDPDQIDRIVQEQISGTMMTIIVIWGCLVLGGFYMVTKTT